MQPFDVAAEPAALIQTKGPKRQDPPQAPSRAQSTMESDFHKIAERSHLLFRYFLCLRLHLQYVF